MSGPSAVPLRPGRARRCPAVLSALSALLAGLLATPAALAATDAAPPAPVPQRSAMDAPLFYQLLIGEIELRQGHAGNAYEVIFDAARRQNDDQLYERAVQIALEARAGEQALSAVQAWRRARPRAVEPLRYQAQLLLAMNRAGELVEPLSSWLKLARDDERLGVLANVPRLLGRIEDRAQALKLGEQVLEPWREPPATRMAAGMARAQLLLAAGRQTEALALAGALQQAQPDAPGPALLALDQAARQPEAEALVLRYLAQPGALPAVRLAWVRQLALQQRYGDALAQLDRVTREQPRLPEPWLTLGAMQLELRQPQAAEQALQTYLQRLDEAAADDARQQAERAARQAGSPGGDEVEADADETDDAPATDREEGRTQAWLLLAQAAEQRGDLPAADAWLARIDNPQRALEVQGRRAALLLRRGGTLDQARALIRAAPERTGEEARAKVVTEVQLLREAKAWREAGALLEQAVVQRPEDTDLIYEHAMVEEKLDRLDRMEALLRRVIALKPDHAHAYNALGYSLADRGLRLDEARDLIRRALELTPGDPFITDSLGWVEFRLGRTDEALRLLRQAYAARPDPEIAVHLGEVLWSVGQQDDARRLWREARERDADNAVLRETLQRLRVTP
ncbi:MAG: hypothetical protein RLY78_2581 [Pseudomonadota bacterium]